MKLNLLLILVSLIWNTPAYSQSEVQENPASPKNDMGWHSLGMGVDWVGTKKYNDRLAFGLTFNLGRAHFWQLGMNGNSTIFGAKPISALHVGSGYSLVNRWGRIAIAGGPAFVTGKEYSTERDKYNRFYTAGLAVNAHFSITPIKEIGIGIEYHANVNFHDHFRGYRLIMIIEGHK